MSTALFLNEPYLREASGRVVAHTDVGGVVLDQSLFYATGGGQPGDTGRLIWEGGQMGVSDAVKAGQGTIALVPGDGEARPPVGTHVTQKLDWARRWGHMRVHTALHLLSVVIPQPVSGGAIAETKGRLDFNMPEAPADKDAIEAALLDLIQRDLPVSESWISDADLDANPELVKTLSVRPPRGTGRIRLIRIGERDTQIDLQPCGGTHVARTGEIGPIHLGKIEKKGRENRRVYLLLAS